MNPIICCNYIGFESVVFDDHTFLNDTPRNVIWCSLWIDFILLRLRVSWWSIEAIRSVLIKWWSIVASVPPPKSNLSYRISYVAAGGRTTIFIIVLLKLFWYHWFIYSKFVVYLLIDSLIDISIDISIDLSIGCSSVIGIMISIYQINAVV